MWHDLNIEECEHETTNNTVLWLFHNHEWRGMDIFILQSLFFQINT